MLRHSLSSSVLISKRADVLVELAGRRRRNPSEKLMLRARQALEDTIAIERRARNYFPLDPTPCIVLKTNYVYAERTLRMLDNNEAHDLTHSS